MATRRVVLADLPLAEKERFYEFLVANKVEFVADESGSKFVATILVVPPEPAASRVTGRVRSAQKRGLRGKSQEPAIRPKSALVSAQVPDAAATLKAAQSVLRRQYSRFCGLLPALSQPPKAVRRSALIRIAEEVYNARYEKDAMFIKSEAAGESGSKAPQTFPDFLYEFATKRYGLKSLVSNNCWGIVSSVELLRGMHVGVDLFGRFIEESYDATDLLFFLFARSAIERVMAQSAQAAEKDKEEAKKEEVVEPAKGKGKPKLKTGPSASSSNGFFKKEEARMTLIQMVQVVKMSIDSKRQELRELVIKKLDIAMAARTEGAARKAPTLEPERLLAIATEEFHNSRDLRSEALGGDGSSDKDRSAPSYKDLSPEIKKEVNQVTQRLLASLEASGEQDVNQQQVHEWAVTVTLRRHKLGNFMDEPSAAPAWAKKLGMQDASSKLDSLNMPSADVVNLSPEEFEKNLEVNVRKLLMSATSELIVKAVASLPDKTFTNDEVASASLKAALISEFAPTADVLMEAIVSNNHQSWLTTLKISNGTAQQKEDFGQLHQEFQQTLNSDITPSVVQKMCRAVVSADELMEQMQARAEALSELGKSSTLNSDEDEGESP